MTRSVESGEGIVRLTILISPQLLMFTGIGATKSFNSEVNELPEFGS